MLCLLASKDRRIVDGHRRVLAMAWQMGYRRLWAKLNSFRCCKSYISCCCLSPMLESAKLGSSQADSVLVEWLFPPQRHSQKQCINLDVAFIALESFVYFQGICCCSNFDVSSVVVGGLMHMPSELSMNWKPERPLVHIAVSQKLHGLLPVSWVTVLPNLLCLQSCSLTALLCNMGIKIVGLINWLISVYAC
ncbi:hypothetical protein H0E87_013625 [Populus deltoides]|uniref:Uncharacterized protein n=1 Tax=Populus deltoides TaxID=3696 RepID=A0A8T2YPL8_POPDE|nr:hypothetical protein H0E87_013625 [Populus deltoides]